MPVNNDTLNNQLYDTLRSKGYDPIALDSKGDPNNEVEKADVFRLSFNQDGKTQHAWATIEGNDLVLYIDDNFTKIDEFEPFTRYMKVWAQRKLLGFNVTNKDHLVNDMRKRTVMKNKEKLGEGYYPMGKKASYNDSVPQVKIILQHTRQIEEGEQRFRNIARIFVENTNGERFLLPTTRPGLARVYARHIAEGGTPYDERGHHITKLVEDYTKMAGFVRATRNGQFNESALKLVNEGLSYYNNLRMTLQGMASHRGYNKYFENYTPVLNEESDDNTSLNELFVQETLDPRIENVMPILKRLSKNVTEISEIKELEQWAETITEVEDETTKTLAEPAEDMLESGELSKGGHRYSERPYVCVHAKKGKCEIYADSSYEAVKKAAKKWGLKSTAGIDAHLADVKHTPVNEAPGAETLKHNQDTEKSNLKAFDLEEEVSVKYEVRDKNGNRLGTWDGINFKSYDLTKYKHSDMIPPGTQVDKASGPMSHRDLGLVKAGVKEEELEENTKDQIGGAFGSFASGFSDAKLAKAIVYFMQGRHQEGEQFISPTMTGVEPKIRNKIVSQLKSLPKLKQGIDPNTDTASQKYINDQVIPWIKNQIQTGLKEGSDVKYFYVTVDGEQKFKTKDEKKARSMAEEMKKDSNFDGKDINVVEKSDYQVQVGEDLDANQKRAGQLGPTEKVGPKGAVGKLVGASESINYDEDSILLNHITKLAGR
jgi:hypothetical protein